jgi:hypothetical protein
MILRREISFAGAKLQALAMGFEVWDLPDGRRALTYTQTDLVAVITPF